MKILPILGLLLAGLLAGAALMVLTNGPPDAGAGARSSRSGPTDHAQPEAHPGAARRGYQLRAGEILRYRLRLQSAIAVHGALFDRGAGAADSLGIHFDGQLLLAIRESGPTQIRARAWLEGETLWRVSATKLRAQPGSALDEQLRQGAELRLTPDGRLLELVTACSRDEPAYGVLAHILASCQVAVPPGQGPDWTTEEQSPVGRYLGHYQASLAEPGRLTLTKTRQFIELEHPRLKASSRDSVRACFDDRRGHLESLSAQQQLSVRLLEAEVYSAHTEVSLQLLERSTGRLPTPLVHQAASELFAPRPLADPLAADRALAGDARLEELLARLPQTLSGTMDARLQLLERLAARLRIAPSEALLTVESILSQPVGSEAEDFLIAALGAAGHREAGQALLEVAAARGNNAASLLSVLPAVGQLHDASPQVEDFLFALSAGAAEELRGTALLAMGAVARRGGSSRLVAHILSELEGGTVDPWLGFSALANSCSPAMLPLVEHNFHTAPTAEVRALAVSALRGVPDPQADSLLEEALADGCSAVRRQAALAWRARGLRPLALQRLGTLAVGDGDALTRMAALEALASELQTPAVKELVAQAAAADVSEDVRALAARLLAR